MFAFNYPFVAFIANDPTAMARVPPILRGGVNAVAMLLLIGTIVLAIGWLIRQLQRAISREPLNVPKYLLLAAAIPMHWVALVTPMPAKPIALVAILTIYHNLQYHRLIWFHNQKYRGKGVSPLNHAQDARVTFGPAAVISRRLIFYIAFGILFASFIRDRASFWVTSICTPATRRRRFRRRSNWASPFSGAMPSFTTISIRKSGACGEILRSVRR
jgi:hypothetical protein